MSKKLDKTAGKITTEPTWRELAIDALKAQLPTYIKTRNLDDAIKCLDLIDRLRTGRFGYLPAGLESGVAVRE